MAAQDNVRRVRPGRDNIAAPDLPAGLAWVGAEPESMPALTAGGPALVHFLDFAQLNSVRTLPYLSEWARRYREAGLSVIGVQSPRFPFGADAATRRRRAGRARGRVPGRDRRRARALGRLRLRGLAQPLPLEPRRRPRLGPLRRGRIPGDRDRDPGGAARDRRPAPLPEPMAPLRPTDAPGARVMAPTPEIFPGGSWERPWTAGEDGEELALDYAAGGAYATVEGSGRDRGRARRRAGASRSPSPPPASTRSPSTRATRRTALPSAPPPVCESGRVSFAAGAP